MTAIFGVIVGLFIVFAVYGFWLCWRIATLECERCDLLEAETGIRHYPNDLCLFGNCPDCGVSTPSGIHAPKAWSHLGKGVK